MCMLWYRGHNEVFDYHSCGHLYEVPEIQIQDFKFIFENYNPFGEKLIEFLIKYPDKLLSENQKNKLIEIINLPKINKGYYYDQGDPEYFGHN